MKEKNKNHDNNRADAEKKVKPAPETATDAAEPETPETTETKESKEETGSIPKDSDLSWGEHADGLSGVSAESVQVEPDETSVLKSQLEQAQTALVDAEGKRLLALAEMDNQRKRLAREMESVRNNVMLDTVSPFLQVFDHLKMAVDAAGKAEKIESITKGLSMIQAEFDKALKNLNIDVVDAVGKDFDPKFHEAMSQEPSDTVPAGKVIRQWCAGYRIKDRLLKPAMVVVSTGKASPEQKQ